MADGIHAGDDAVRQHVEGVYSGEGETYIAKCTCGWVDGPHDTPGEARKAADAHVA